jgi:hypothetical protein
MPATLAERDDLRHDIGTDPDARESKVFNVLLPDEGIFVIGYFTMKATTETTRILIVLETDAAPVVDIAPDQPFEGADLDDFTVAGMHVTQPERSRSMTVAYTGDRIGLDYRFDAIHEPFSFDRNADGVAPVAATNRFEQAGRIAGTVTFDGREIPFDTTGHRDHSWGVRDYDSILHWKWISAQAGPETAIHAMHIWYQGRQYTNGYVFLDGLLSPIVDLKVRATYDDQVVQRTGDFTILDEAGRTTTAHADYFAGAPVPLGNVVMVEAGCRFSIAGRDGVGVFEQGWQPAYYEHLRSGRYAPEL